MKKLLLAAICGISLAFCSGCDNGGSSHHVDYVKSDGSATRMNYTSDSRGNLEVSKSHVSPEQRSTEATWGALATVVYVLVKGISHLL